MGVALKRTKGKEKERYFVEKKIDEQKMIKNNQPGVPIVAQWLTNPTRNHEVSGSIPALAQRVKIWQCREPWCRLQTRLGSRVAVALA